MIDFDKDELREVYAARISLKNDECFGCELMIDLSNTYKSTALSSSNEQIEERPKSIRTYFN